MKNITTGQLKDLLEKEFKDYNLTRGQRVIISDIFLNHIRLIDSEMKREFNLEDPVVQAYADNIKASIVHTINLARIH